MNRFDRITAIFLQLQSRRVVKGADLAKQFGVSLRTVYRDLRTLEEAGVPLSGEAGVGYSLADGYRLPPVMFTREEATALITAEKLVAQLTDAHTAQLSHAAMDKLRAVLRRPDRDYLEALSPRITVLHPARRRPELLTHTNVHQQLLAAIAGQQVVALSYRAGYEGRASERDVEPIAVYFGQYWHVVAFCRLRQEFRDFRLDRIEQLVVRAEQFAQRPETLQSFWQERTRQRQPTAATVRFRPESVGRVHENKQHFGATHEQPTPDGGLEVTFLVGSLQYLARWLLLFGAHAHIVMPPELREHARQLAQAAYEHFSAEL
ncbi:helix-turn-helix transcriptional regulator [Hymenobacter negativus]|uniref:YafY family transcriptional regulator n=1 Tax=Hymenobacter negativus TaxID=2795026 RepID=A0ABS3QBK5_9BACT|nr:YafY family protein [Hymenobacter negativus]MBO2008636.1 YafY family transcriptional regulator [Hymenobacter negativus]